VGENLEKILKISQHLLKLRAIKYRVIFMKPGVDVIFTDKNNTSTLLLCCVFTEQLVLQDSAPPSGSWEDDIFYIYSMLAVASFS